MIRQLHDLIQANGDGEVVSGVARSGYGEPVTRVAVRAARSFNDESGKHDGPVITVFDIELSDESIVGS
jgi:hypothetical protein